MSDRELGERIAALETEVKHANEHSEKLESKIDHVDEKLDAGLAELSKYKGWLGGVLLVVTLVVSAIKLAWGYIKEHWTW